MNSIDAHFKCLRLQQLMNLTSRLEEQDYSKDAFHSTIKIAIDIGVYDRKTFAEEAGTAATTIGRWYVGYSTPPTNIARKGVYSLLKQEAAKQVSSLSEELGDYHQTP